MDTFTRSLVDVSFARQVASVLYDSTQNSEAVTASELAESIGFLDSVDAAVERSLKDRPTIKSKNDLPRDPVAVRKGIVLERTGLLSTLIGLGAFDGLVSDENGNPVSFCSRIGINGGFARVGDVPVKTEKKEGEKKGKNPDAWKAVPPAFVERMKRMLETLTADSKSITRDNLVVAMMEDAKREAKEFLQSGDYHRWGNWISLTREGNPALRDEKGRLMYDTLQGRTGGLKRASYTEEVLPAKDEAVSTASSTEAAVSAEETLPSTEETSDSPPEFTEVVSSES